MQSYSLRLMLQTIPITPTYNRDMMGGGWGGGAVKPHSDRLVLFQGS